MSNYVEIESFFRLPTAWSWSTNFDLQERLDELSAELSECGFEGLAENQNLLMKCFTGYILGKASPSAIMELNGDKIRDNFDDIKCGLKSAVDFLKKELNIHSLKYLPYPTMMVALVRFFGGKWKNGTLYSDKQRKELIQWFWKCCFSRRYSSGVNNIIEDELISMQKLRIDENYHIATLSCELNPHFFTKNLFNITSVNTKTSIVMLACNNPKSFISGANVDLSRTLQVARELSDVINYFNIDAELTSLLIQAHSALGRLEGISRYVSHMDYFRRYDNPP